MKIRPIKQETRVIVDDKVHGKSIAKRTVTKGRLRNGSLITISTNFLRSPETGKLEKTDKLFNVYNKLGRFIQSKLVIFVNNLRKATIR